VAVALWAEILVRIEAGVDFVLMVKLHTDDSDPVSYSLAVSGRQSAVLRGRAEMVPGFGDVAWRLAVGEVGVARHDPEKSPFGSHLIKRLR
jgi:parvulin-like peptidyl-prolyl isomerase